MCLHSVLNLSPVERVKKCRFSNTNKNQNCTKIAFRKNTILLGFGYSTLTFMSKRAPKVRPQKDRFRPNTPFQPFIGRMVASFVLAGLKHLVSGFTMRNIMRIRVQHLQNRLGGVQPTS